MLDPVIHQAQRLRVMAALFRNREASFTSLRDGLGLTDGNLSSHASRLQEAGYLTTRRVLAGVGFEVRYRITPLGSERFRAYAEELRRVLALAETAPDAREDAPRTPREEAHVQEGP